MNRVLVYICLAALLAALGWREAGRGRARPAQAAADSCAACHLDAGGGLSPAHSAEALGCSPCHLGNGRSWDKDRAHHGMVRNPGDLRHVEATCGRGDCHPDLAARVKTSVMATASGILDSLDALWGRDGSRDAAMLWNQAGPRDPGADYFSKLCAACHLWWPRGRGAGEQRLRGGGCSACHLAGEPGRPPERTGEFSHSRLTMRVPMENCVRCHNRSARIGLSYQGLVEAPGYGLPHQGGALNTLRLSGGRFALLVEPDVHFKAGMICIDCHTGAELMGDGTAHTRLRGQLDVACADCHAPRFGDQGRDEAARLAAMNPALPPVGPGPVALTARKGAPLYALRLQAAPGPGTPGKAVLLRKADGKALDVPLPEKPAPHHALAGHERLGCQACHSPLMPQCYGCHVTRRTDRTQLDLLTGRETPGRWEEGLSYARWLRPTLAVEAGGRVAPFSPCQVLVRTLGPGGEPVPGLTRARAAMVGFDPHSTRTASRTCLDCHLDPKTLGLGTGLLFARGGTAFRPVYGTRAQGGEGIFSPEAAVDLDGRAAQDFPLPGDRPLDRGELASVLRVAPCLPCHGRWDDPVYGDFSASLRRLRQGLAPGCACPQPSRAAPRGPGSALELSRLTH